MDPGLVELLTHDVVFEPRQGTDRQGQAGGFGPPTAPVKGRFSWQGPTRRVSGQPGEEDVAKAGVVYLDAGDFDRAQVPLGSKVRLLDGTSRVVTGAHLFTDEHGPYAWRISFA